MLVKRPHVARDIHTPTHSSGRRFRRSLQNIIFYATARCNDRAFHVLVSGYLHSLIHGNLRLPTAFLVRAPTIVCTALHSTPTRVRNSLSFRRTPFSAHDHHIADFCCPQNSQTRPCITSTKCVHISNIEPVCRSKRAVRTFPILMLSTSVKNGEMVFSSTTFHAVPIASAELSRTSGSVTEETTLLS